jgi:hypothetical protein
MQSLPGELHGLAFANEYLTIMGSVIINIM